MNNQNLYRNTKKLINEANRRLERLNRGKDLNKGRYNPKTKRFERPDTKIVIRNGKKVKLSPTKIVSYKTGTWASKKLVERVPESIIGGKITTNISNYSQIQLLALNKALKNFLKSETSTIEGIQKKENEIKREMSARLNEYGLEQLTSEDIESLYQLRHEVSSIYDYITPSDLEYNVKFSVAMQYNGDQFIEQVVKYTGDETPYIDLDLQQKLKDAYLRMAPYFKN